MSRSTSKIDARTFFFFSSPHGIQHSNKTLPSKTRSQFPHRKNKNKNLSTQKEISNFQAIFVMRYKWTQNEFQDIENLFEWIKWKLILVTMSFIFSNGLKFDLVALPRAFKIILKIIQNVEIRHICAKVADIKIWFPLSFTHNFLFFFKSFTNGPGIAFQGF